MSPLLRGPDAKDADYRFSIDDSPTYQMFLSDNLELMISFVRSHLGTIASDPRVSLDWNILGGRRLLSRLSTACGIGSSFEVVYL